MKAKEEKGASVDVISTAETLGETGFPGITRRCLLGMVRQYPAPAMHARELRVTLQLQQLQTRLSWSHG